jgi:hypothetical protein
VVLEGERLVVSATRDDERGTDAGACYIFERNRGGANQWGLVKKLIPDDLGAGDMFGVEPSLSGDTLVVGASGQAGYTGASYIFERNQGGSDNWGLVKKITAPDGSPGDRFGLNALDGDILVVSAYRDDDVGFDVGSAYVFYRNRGGTDNWGFVKKLLPNQDELPETRFGVDLDLEGDTVALNASGYYSGALIPGTVYLFQKDMGGPDNWGLAHRVEPSDPTAQKQFGAWNAVDLSDGILAVGATGDNQGGNRAGAAYVFDLLPAIQLTPQGNQLQISWINPGGACFAVEHCLCLAPFDFWSLLPHGRDNPCAVSMNDPAGFFRLVRVPPLAIIEWPTSLTVSEGDSITLQVQATGLDPLSYEWRLNDALIEGATQASLTIDQAQASDGGVYTVTVSDACGSVTTEPATLTVEP